ncbi:MAG: Gfo/Idh/MocA family oxidoreductase [Deltaproteobacteria bacterium]|nr:Gfo/Idh/MocA family oxidoreductase [Deltaproteobacteria bacterium]
MSTIDLHAQVTRLRRQRRSGRPAPLRVGIWGPGKRALHFYAPIVRALGDELELVGVAGRHEARAQVVAEPYECAAFDSIDELIEKTRPDLLIVCVSYGMNGIAALRALDFGIPLLLETPLSSRLRECDAIVQLVAEKDLPVQVAEQNFLFPVEQMKTQLVSDGLFGEIVTVENDYWGFRYHGMSQLRMLAGFSNPVQRVRGMERTVKVWPHPSKWDGNPAREDERWWWGWLEHAWGTVSLYHYTSICYDAPIRGARSLRFYGAGGFGSNEHYWRFDADRTGQEEVRVEWEWNDLGEGARALAALVARPVGGAPIRWENPFADLPFDDDHIGVACSLMELVRAIRAGRSDVRYGVEGGRIDQELCTAIEVSHRMGGEALAFPLDRGLLGEWD